MTEPALPRVVDEVALGVQRGVFSPTIFTVLRTELTVPSLPSPKKTVRVTSGVSVEKSLLKCRLIRLTSSRMPTVKWRRGRGSAILSKIAAAMGVNSLEESP